MPETWTPRRVMPAPTPQQILSSEAEHIRSRDCAVKLRLAEDRAERYRHALAQIWRYSDCRTALRYADEALSATEAPDGV